MLDEATAAVDRETDAQIQEVVRKALAGVTVISIAHRLDTIIDFDRVIVMDAGRVVEFDTPAELLREGGHFADLVRSTGPDTEARLREAAFSAEQIRCGKLVNHAE